jgi:hypothetical protein
VIGAAKVFVQPIVRSDGTPDAPYNVRVSLVRMLSWSTSVPPALTMVPLTVVPRQESPL